MHIKEYIEMNRIFYGISWLDCINYLMSEHALNLRQLLEYRDENGRVRTEQEREAYRNNRYGIAQNDLYVYRKRLKRNPDKELYEDFCTRLQVKADLSVDSIEKIKHWKDITEDNTTNKAGRPTSELIEKKQKAIEASNKWCEELYEYEEETSIRLEEELDKMHMQDFSDYAASVSKDILDFWHQYSKIFLLEYGNELDFIEIYGSLNTLGRKVIKDIILNPFEESDYKYTDYVTEYIEHIKKGCTTKTEKNDAPYCIQDIYDKWAHAYTMDEFDGCQKVTEIMLNFSKEDWDCVINYHRLVVLGKKLELESDLGIGNVPFVDFFKLMVDYIAAVKSFKN